MHHIVEFFSTICRDSGAVSTKKTKTDDSKDEKVKESNDKKSNTSSEVTKKKIQFKWISFIHALYLLILDTLTKTKKNHCKLYLYQEN